MKSLGKAVLILPDNPPERTRGGLLIPATARDKPQTGTVIDKGPECRIIVKGQRVIFPRKSASIIVIDNVDHYFINENRLLYIAGKEEKL